MRISIALCTYNGARHLDEQLRSIEKQTRQPDELVICDDCSSDETTEIAHAFSKRAKFLVKWTANEQNLGTVRNFAKALSLCAGDLIALSDQDDVWRPDKLEKLERALLSRSDAGMVFSDADAVDEDLRPLGYRLWDAIEFCPRERAWVRAGRALKVLLRHNVVTGATMMFRSSLKDLVLPIPEVRIHDEWLGLAIATQAPVVLIEEPLVLYRQHPRQQIGARRRTLSRDLSRIGDHPRKAYRDRAEVLRQLGARLASLGCDPLTLSLINSALHHADGRATLPRSRLMRIPFVFRELIAMRYVSYSRGWRSILLDLVRSVPSS